MTIKNKKAQLSGLGNRVLTVVFGIILIVAVAIPISVSVITQEQNTTWANGSVNGSERIIQGSTATVAGFIPLFLALAGLALAAALVG